MAVPRFTALLTCLLLAPHMLRAETQLKEGNVYSYMLDGVRYYKSAPPTDPRATEVKFVTHYRYRAQPEAPAFGSYRCTQSCSGHRAGYDWAQRRGVTRFDQCAGRSRSFIEGCFVYVQGLP